MRTSAEVIAPGVSIKAQSILIRAVSQSEREAVAPKNASISLDFWLDAPGDEASPIEHHVPLSRVVEFQRVGRTQVQITILNDDGSTTTYQPRSFLARTASLRTVWGSNIDSISDILLHNQLCLRSLADLGNPSPSTVAEQARSALGGLSHVSCVWWRTEPKHNTYAVPYSLKVAPPTSGVIALDRLVALEPVGGGKFRVIQRTYDGELVLAETAEAGGIHLRNGIRQKIQLPNRLINAFNIREILGPA